MTKLHRTNERSWLTAVTMSEFDKLAHEAVGRESSEDEVRREVRDMWEKSMRQMKNEMEKEVEVEQDEKDERLRDPRRMERVKREWIRKLEVADGVVRARASVTHKEVDEGDNDSVIRDRDESDEDEQVEEVESPRRTRKVQGRPALGGYKTLGSMTNLALHQAQVKTPQQVAPTSPSSSRPRPSMPSPPSSPPRPPISANRGVLSHPSPATLFPKTGRSDEVENHDDGDLPAAGTTKGKPARASLQAPGSPKKSRPRHQERPSAVSMSSHRVDLHMSTTKVTEPPNKKRTFAEANTEDLYAKLPKLSASSSGAESGLPGERLDRPASAVVHRKREAPDSSGATSPPSPKKARTIPEQEEQEQQKRPVDGVNAAESLRAQSTMISSASLLGPPGGACSHGQQTTLVNSVKEQVSTFSSNITRVALLSAPGQVQEAIPLKAKSTHLPQTRTPGSVSVSASVSRSRSHAEGLHTAPNQYTEPFQAFLSDAVVWFGAPSTPEGSETTVYRPQWRRSSEHIVVPSSRIGSLDIFLSACGWGAARAHPGVPSDKATKGVTVPFRP